MTKIEMMKNRYQDKLNRAKNSLKRAGSDYYEGYCEGKIEILEDILKELEEMR